MVTDQELIETFRPEVHRIGGRKKEYLLQVNPTQDHGCVTGPSA